jgi:hypothetical protein
MSATIFRQLSRRSHSITTTHLRKFTTSLALCKKDRSRYVRVPPPPVDPDYEDYSDVRTVSRRNKEFHDRMALLLPADGDAYPLMETKRERDGQVMRHVEFRNKYDDETVLAPGEKRTEEKVTIRGVFLFATTAVLVVSIANKTSLHHIELR